MWVLWGLGCVLFDGGSIPLSCDELNCDLTESTLRIIPEEPTITDTLSCILEPEVPEADIVSYRWIHEDGTALAQTQNLTLSPGFVSKNDTLSCTVTLNEALYVNASLEASVQIVNTPPEISALGISPPVPVLAYSGLFCVPTVTDLDGDELDFSISWTLNGASFSNVQSDGSIAAADIYAGDQWQCTLSVSDGEEAVEQVSPEYIAVEGLDLAFVPAQTLMIGSPESEEGRDLDETWRSVTLNRDYYIMTTEVTESMYGALTGLVLESECWDCPISAMSWSEAAELANLLSEWEGLPKCYSCESPNGYPECELDIIPYDCLGYRMPTEAEWEVAARSGSDDGFHIGHLFSSGTDCFEGEFAYDQTLGDIAWYCHNASEVQVVGLLNTNSYGLHDMHGNLWEWTNDSYKVWGNSSYTNPFVFDNYTRVIKGGSYLDNPIELRAASRRNILTSTREPNIGVRFVRLSFD